MITMKARYIIAAVLLAVCLASHVALCEPIDPNLYERDISGALLKAKSIRCHFETGCYASWDQGQLGARITDEHSDISVRTYQDIDLQEGSAKMVGEIKSYDMKVDEVAGGITLTKFWDHGSIEVVTVFPIKYKSTEKYLTVWSRHSITPKQMPFPSQNYGTCEILERAGSSETKPITLDIPKDTVKGFKWLYEAALGGDASAQYEVANMFWLGKGIAQNKEQAVQWYRKAAEQGHEDAQATLETLYEQQRTGNEQSSKEEYQAFRRRIVAEKQKGIPETPVNPPLSYISASSVKIEIYEDGELTDHKILASYGFARDRQGQWHGYWRHIYICPWHEQGDVCLKIESWSIADKQITNFQSFANGCSFDLSLGSLFGNRKMQIVIKKGGFNNVVLGSAIWYSDILGGELKKEWKSTEATHFELPYKRVF